MRERARPVPERLAAPAPERRVLVVEDDPDVATVVATALERQGYEVATASTVDMALRRVERCGLPHLAIVDIGLPGASGLEFCRAVQRTSDLPIILLTGVDDGRFKADALRTCAEDYIVKPFHLDELLARVERVLRRMRDDPPVALATEGQGLSVNFPARLLCGKGKSVALTCTESKLLHVLMAHEDVVLPVRYLEQRLWPEQGAMEETLRVHISRLRRKIAAADPDFVYLRTERGLGYCFVQPHAGEARPFARVPLAER